MIGLGSDKKRSIQKKLTTAVARKDRQKVAGTTRFELATSGVTGQRSNQLSYAPNCSKSICCSFVAFWPGNNKHRKTKSLIIAKRCLDVWLNFCKRMMFVSIYYFLVCFDLYKYHCFFDSKDNTIQLQHKPTPAQTQIYLQPIAYFYLL